MSHYDTLGVERGATPAQIRRAFRKLASQHHPDRGGDTERMKRVNDAFAVLGDEQRRRRYDETGREDEPPDLERLARGILGRHFETHLEAEDLLGAVRQQLCIDADHMRSKIRQAGITAAKLTKQRKRIRVRAGLNIVHALIDEKIDQAKALIERETLGIEVGARALKMLDDYEQDTEVVTQFKVSMRGAYGGLL